MAKTRSAHQIPVWIAAAVLIVAVLAIAPAARAQSGGNLPPPGAYQPIPNYTGIGAGLLFRNAINDRFSGVTPVSPTIVNLAFSDLPVEQDGALIYCNDCQRANPCSSGGSGAWAFGAQGQWECTAPSSPASLASPPPIGNSTPNSVYATDLHATSVAGAIAGSGANNNINSLAAVQTMTGPDSSGDVISGYNVNGRVEVTTYGGSGAGLNVTTGTISASSTVLTVGSTTGWRALSTNPMGIIVQHAGAALGFTTPSAPTLATYGTAGSTSYGYKCAALSSHYDESVASAETTIATGNATLSSTNGIFVTCGTMQANQWGWAVYRTTTGGHTAALIAVTVDTAADDEGQSAPVTMRSWPQISATPPAAELAGWLQTTVTSVGSGVLNLATAATTAVTSAEVDHDDTPAILAAEAAVGSSGGAELHFPAGTYFFCGTPWNASRYRVAGDGVPVTSLYTCYDDYTFQPSGFLNGSSLRAMTFEGGLGVLHHTYTGSNSDTSQVTVNAPAYDFTNLAYGTESSDFPFWYFGPLARIQALDFARSIGIMLSGTGGSRIAGVDFEKIRVAVKYTHGGAASDVIDASTFIANSNSPNFPTIGIWRVLTNASGSPGTSSIVENSKFGNEHLISGNLRSLYAEDGSGADESTKMPAFKFSRQCTTTAGNTTLTCNDAPFASGDAGDAIVCLTCGPNQTTLTTTIASYTDASHVVLATAPSITKAITNGFGAIVRWGVPSNNVIDQITYKKNYYAGAGSAPTPTSPVPVVFSMTPNVRGVIFDGLSFAAPNPSELLEKISCTPTSGGDSSYRNSASGLTFLTSLALPWVNNPSNCAGSVTLAPGQSYYAETNPGTDSPYTGMLAPPVSTLLTTGILGFTISGTASIGALSSPAADPYGGQNGANITFAANSDSVHAALGTIQAGIDAPPIWIEGFIAQGASSSMDEATIQIAPSATPTTPDFRQLLSVPTVAGVWKPFIAGPYRPKDTGATPTLLIEPAVTTSDTGQISIANLQVCQSRLPCNAPYGQPLTALSEWHGSSSGINLPTTATNSLEPLTFGSGGTATWQNATSVVLRPTSLQDLYVETTSLPGSGNTWVFTVRKNNVSTSLSCTITNSSIAGPDGSYFCEDSNFAHAVIAGKGDALELLVTGTGTPAASTGRWAVTVSQ
jgi:hypothetical protein